MASCKDNPSLAALKDSQGSLKDKMSQGKDALGDISSLQSKMTEKLNEFAPELPEGGETLQEKIQALKSSESGQAFSEKYAEIKQKFGDAWDEMDAELEKLGLGSYPPSYDVTTNFVKEKSGVDLTALASGDYSSLQAKIEADAAAAEAAGETPGPVPDVTAIMSGDYSSLGVELPDFDAEPDQLCKSIPNMEFKEGEGVTKKATSPLNAKIPPFEIKIPTSSQMNEAIKAGMLYTEAQSNFDEFMKQNMDAWLIALMSEEDYNNAGKKAKGRILIMNSLRAWYRKKIAEMMGYTYEDWMARIKKPTGVSYSEMVAVKNQLASEGTDIETIYYNTVKEYWESKNDTSFTWETIVPQVMNNRYPLPGTGFETSEF